MTSPLYQTTPTRLPGSVNSDLPDGVETSFQAPQIVYGDGDPTGVVTASPGSFYTDTATDTVYSNTTGAKADWVVINGGSTSPLTTKGDLFGFSTVDARFPLGTQGQVLSVNTGGALGLAWIDNGPLVSKGDIYTFGGGVPARLPVGSNGKILSADSGQTTGLNWITAPDLSAYLTSADASATYRDRVLSRTAASSTQVDGGTFNCSYGQNVNLMHFAADVATFTVGINTPPAGEQVRVAFDHAIAAVTWTHGGGGVLFASAPPAAIAAGDHFTFIYDDYNNLLWMI